MTESVAVIGAGLVGTLAALGFAKRGYEVSLFDLRADPRTITAKNLRSINLAVSARGIEGMKAVDEEMCNRLLEGIIPMKGRMIHDLEGNQESQIYGLFGESINSIDRAKLNEDMITEIDRFNRSHQNKVQTCFNHKLIKLDLPSFSSDKSKKCKLEFTVNSQDDTKIKEFDFVLGADGSYSNVRYQLQKYIRMDYQQEYIDKCYLELYIPPGPNGTFSIDPNHLHIWPRKEFMLIALANGDGSFTSTFFGPWTLTESLNTSDKIIPFFKENFPDAVDLIGLDNIVKVFMENPRGALMQVTCSQYNYSDRCIIIGDAAHSMVPFYGQGMNCGFEDVRILLELLDKYDSRKEAFDQYTQTRGEDLKAILKLALNNYKEMSTKVISQLYLFRKTLDGILGKLIPDYWVPMYSMVSFRADIPYSQCIEREKRQTSILKGVEFLSITAIAVGIYTKFMRK